MEITTNISNKCTICRRTIFFVLLVLGSLCVCIGESLAKPYTAEQILDLLQKKLSHKDIIDKINDSKVDFELTDELNDNFRDAGAKDDLIKAIRKNRQKEETVHQKEKTRPIPYTANQIIELLKERISENDIIKQVEKSKVNFEVTDDLDDKLREEGARAKLIRAIRSNRYQQEFVLKINSPSEDEECGHSVVVNGKTSSILPNKYLWVFAHRRGLTKWWPQSGAVKVENNGSWEQTVYLGNEKDINSRFEIIVMWVDAEDNKKIENDMRAAEATGNYKGRELPKGSPSAQVTVIKARH